MSRMKAIVSVFAIAFGVLAGTAFAGETDFPVELLGDVNGMAFPRLSAKTTGALVKAFGNNCVWIEKWASNEDKAKRSFFRAVGQLLEIADEDDFIQLARDFGYEIYSGSNVERKIEVSGFYNELTEPTINASVSRACDFTLGRLADARGELDGYLALNWDGSFALDIEIDLLVYKVKLFKELADFSYYVDRGDVLLLRGFLQAAEGALYLARAFDFSSMDWEAATAALEKFGRDCGEGGASAVAAFDASAFAHLPFKGVADLRTAKAKFLSALDDIAAGEAYVKARTDGQEHLLDKSSKGLAEVLDAIATYRDVALTCLDQLIAPMNLATATIPMKPLEIAYTGEPQSPLIGTVTVGDVAAPYELVGTTNATAVGTYEMTLVGYGRSTGSQSVTWKIVIPPPAVRDDAKADVREDGQGGYVVTPSGGQDDVVVTIPLGLDAKTVAVEVSPTVKRVTPNGAALRIVRVVSGLGSVDISACLDIPKADAGGVVDLSNASVKEEIVREALDTGKDAVIRLNAQEPTLKTAKTRPGLVYTLVEGATLDTMGVGDSKVGDGQAWAPTLSVKGGKSGFYTIRVTK